MVAKWKDYQSRVLPILEQYRNDELFETAEEAHKILDDIALELNCLNEYIHKEALICWIYEKPTKEDLDEIMATGVPDEYDQLLEIVKSSQSFQEANERSFMLLELE